MSWSYSGDPTSSPKDEVRFLIGDTRANYPMMSDEEIIYCITLVYGSLEAAPAQGNFLPAAYAADNLATKYAGMADKSVGDLHISYSNQFRQYQQLAQRLRARATNWLIPIYSGGQFHSEKTANYSDPDRATVAIKVDGMDYVTPDNRLKGPEDTPGNGP